MRNDITQNVHQRCCTQANEIAAALETAFGRDYRVHCRDLDAPNDELPSASLVLAFQFDGHGAVIVLHAEDDGDRYMGKLGLTDATRIHELAESLSHTLFSESSATSTRVGIVRDSNVILRSAIGGDYENRLTLTLRCGKKLTTATIFVAVQDPWHLLQTPSPATWDNEPLIAKATEVVSSQEVAAAERDTQLQDEAWYTTDRVGEAFPAETFPAVKVAATLRLSSKKVDVATIMQLELGSMIHLDHAETVPCLQVHGRSIARGEIVVCGDRIALRVA